MCSIFLAGATYASKEAGRSIITLVVPTLNFLALIDKNSAIGLRNVSEPCALLHSSSDELFVAVTPGVTFKLCPKLSWISRRFAGKKLALINSRCVSFGVPKLEHRLSVPTLGRGIEMFYAPEQ